MKKEKAGLIIIVLLIIIMLLLGVILYFFLIKPHFNNYVFGKQIEAQNILVSNIVAQIQQTGYVQIPVGNETLILVPYQGEVSG